MRLGPPDVSLNHERVFVYSWEMSAGTIAVPISNYVGPVPRKHSVLVEFDEDGRTRSTEMREKWFSERMNLGSLLKKYAAADADSRRWTIVMDPIPEVWAHFDAPMGKERRTSLTVGEYRDARAAPYSGTLLGREWTGRLMGNADIHSRRPVNELIRACVVKQLKDSGFEIVEAGGERTVTGSIDVFKAEGQEVQFEVTVEARSVADQTMLSRRYHYTFTNSVKSFTTDAQRVRDSGLVERFLRVSLENLQEQIARDEGLKKFLDASK